MLTKENVVSHDIKILHNANSMYRGHKTKTYTIHKTETIGY